MSLLRKPLLVLDTETSGMPRHPWARPIELAIVALDQDGEEVAAFETLIRPDELPSEADEALRINQLTREQVMAAPTFDVVDRRLNLWLSDHNLVQHQCTSFNTDFDGQMVARLWPDTWGLPGLWAPCVMRACHRIMDRDPACTLKRWENGELKFPSLTEAALYFGVEVCEPQHRALGDARTAAELVRALARRRAA